MKQPQKQQNQRLRSKLNQRDGFTLIELVIVMVVLAIVAAVAIPRMGDVAENSKVTTTKEEMRRLKVAIVGDPSLSAAGKLTNRGYAGDVGALPSALTDLAIKPGAVSAYNKFTRLGWNGPYIDSANGEYLKDAWGANYTFNSGARTITSTGGASNIVLSF
jgi:prepilin-type N-terminal cleavage/methylation domain-containing protein